VGKICVHNLNVTINGKFQNGEIISVIEAGLRKTILTLRKQKRIHRIGP
jgi:hypothetical protein